MLARKGLQPLLFTIALLAGSAYRMEAQHVWFSTLNYQNVLLNRMDTVANDTFPQIGATYDQNHQRYIYQGQQNNTGIAHLYTIDALTGAVIAEPFCPSSFDQQYIVEGLEYDNGTNTLYGLSGGGLAWIDQTTGIVHPIAPLPPALFGAYIRSAFDTKDHWYILLSGSSLVVVDAASGKIVYNSVTNPNLVGLKFDNTTGILYCINEALTSSVAQFDSVTLATGAVHVIANLPPLYIQGVSIYLRIGPYLGSYTIDEQGGRYIFLAADPDTAACANEYLYALDLKTGAVASKTLYPYSIPAPVWLPTGLTQEYIIDYAFDNLRGVLYALNWYDPLPGSPSVKITASENPVCPGDPVGFEAFAGGQALYPSYQWVVNGQNVGTNSDQYSNNNLVSGDIVYCILSNGGAPCAVTAPVISNQIVIRNATLDTVSVTISDSVGSSPAGSGAAGSGIVGSGASGSGTSGSSAVGSSAVGSVCPEQLVQFTALPVNAGLSPTYQWQVNGLTVGPDSPVFNYNHWVNGDLVVCVLSTQSHCALNKTALSDTIVMQVHKVPSSLGVIASATTICSGDSITFTATPVINGGDSASFQWQVDGRNAGDGPGTVNTFVTSSLANGDQVSCILTSSLYCTAPISSQDTIVMTVNPTPTLSLAADTVIARGSSVQLDPLLTGNIVSYQWAPVTRLNNPSVADPVADPVYTTTYQLAISTDKGCTATGKITVVVYTPLHMPNAFTPAASSNAVFRIPPSLQITLIGFSVFNRSGQRVFTAAGSGDGWDGTFRGQLQPVGTYVWEIDYEDLLTAKPVRATGTVELIR